ncbi:ABC transporter ATP-binding protein [Micromonospora craniellae]|uniref:Fatty acid ABC transporter ATP-binding/permease protein n=2 Tax=Micromonospora craniellae TaxID=2294034 RepID=A0A372FYA7_9ACTN|nr:ABC transporter ATP-binding protein [Micromonospora craniellae]
MASRAGGTVSTGRGDRTGSARRTVGELLAPIRARLIFGAVLAFLSSVSGLLPFVAVVEIGRELLAGNRHDVVWTWVGAGVAGAAAKMLLMVVANLVTHYADADLQRHLRARLARHAAVLPLGWFTGRGSGEFKKAMEDDIEDMHHMVAHAVLDLAGVVGLPVAALIYLVATDWRMTLVTLAVLPAASVALASAHRTLPTRMAELTGAQLDLNNATIEYVDGIQVVKAYGNEGRTHRRLADAVDRFCDSLAAWTAEAGRAMFSSMLLLSPASVLLIVAGVGTGFIVAGWLDPVSLLPFLLVGVGLPAPFMTIVQGTQQLRKARLAAEHLHDVLDEPALPLPAAPAVPTAYGITFDRVSFGYTPDEPVLRDVDLRCPQGAVTAVVGPSGSGKTTLGRLIPRFFDVDAGSIFIGGVDVRSIPQETLLGSIAIVFQDVVLVRDTIRENIRLGRPGATDAEVENAARAARIHETITALPRGYDTMVSGRAGVLSGGQRQRITIARAILQDAPIVLLDEATAYVDPENERAVQQALGQLARGRTLVVVAHRLYTIRNADQIVVLDAGRVVERGTHDSLLAARGRYHAMWEAQNDPQHAGISRRKDEAR